MQSESMLAIIQYVLEEDESRKESQDRQCHHAEIGLVVYEDQERSHSARKPEKQHHPSAVHTDGCRDILFILFGSEISQHFLDESRSEDEDEYSAQEVHGYGYRIRRHPEPALDRLDECEEEGDEHMPQSWHHVSDSVISSHHSMILRQDLREIHIGMIRIPCCRIRDE